MTKQLRTPAKWRPLTFAPSNTVRDVDKRGAARQRVSRIVACRIIHLPKALPLEAHLRDISLTGLGVLAPAWIEPGTFLAITIQNWLGAERTFRAQVMHATRQEPGCWLLGCSLDASLNRAEVEELL